MTTRPTTLTTALPFMPAIIAVWILAAVGQGLVWFGVFITLALAAGWWLAHRHAQQLRSQATTLDHAIQQIDELVSTKTHEPEAVVALVRERLTTANEDTRSSTAVFEAIDEPVLALNADNAISSANQAASALLNPGSSGRMLGELLDQLLPDERALNAIAKAQRGETARAQARLLTSDGPRIIEIAAEPITGQPFSVTNPPTVVVTLRDITEQAIAMQLKTDFVANASHELRTPLASIKAAAETLHEIGEEDPTIRGRLISMIASNAERLEELSRDMLDLSSLESPEAACVTESVDLTVITTGLAELFDEQSKARRVTLEFDLDDRLKAIWTDPRLIRLVLRNLIGNAVKFADAGTVVLVRGAVSENKVSGTFSHTISSVPLGSGSSATTDTAGTARLDAKLEVIDKGIGIPIAQQQRIFERFFQADEARTGSPRRRGTGLGLAIVKHALLALGGTIKVESVWQQGTTMTVELPGCVEAGRV